MRQRRSRRAGLVEREPILLVGESVLDGAIAVGAEALGARTGRVEPVHPQVVYVPVHYEVQQRVIVRETVREEVDIVPGATRVIPAPPPAPPREPIYIKGN